MLLDARKELEKVKAERQEAQEISLSLERRAEILEQIKDAIEGLERTKEHMGKKDYLGRTYDPGKYDIAYFYVARIEEKDIIPRRDFNPGLTELCPECKKQNPVMMSYAQTYDSPDGDTWQKQAFLICCNKVQVLKRVATGGRFLGFY